MYIRQMVLSFGLLVCLAGAFLDDAIAQSQRADSTARPIFVIVHGAWGGGWAFRRVDSMLTQMGNRVYRPTLTGLGERVHLATPDVGLTTHINDVVNMLLFEDLHDVVLVGHSYGGMVITGVADRVPDRIRRLVYVDAFVPNDGDSLMSPEGPRREWMKQMTKGGFIVPFWVRPDQPPPKDVPQPLKTFTEPIVLKNKSARLIPATYILTVESGRKSEEDDFAPQAKRARERGWPVYELQADHNPQWSAPEALVEMLDQNR